MTQPVNIDPDQVNGVAGQWYALIPEFGAPPPHVAGDRPTHQAVQGAIAAAQGATDDLQQQHRDAAGNTSGAAKAYAGQDKDSAKDMVGMCKDMMTGGVTVASTAAQALTAIGSQIAQGGTTVATTLASTLPKMAPTPSTPTSAPVTPLAGHGNSAGAPAASHQPGEQRSENSNGRQAGEQRNDGHA